jgi:hypothetical protein
MNARLAQLALAATVAASLLPATGCLPLGCGGYDGASDRVYARTASNEMLIMCGNGGFVANLQTTTIEGRMEYTADGTAIGVKGDDASLAFDWVVTQDGTGGTTPQLGETAWTQESLDPTALDHADVMCTDLETRTWWNQQ